MDVTKIEKKKPRDGSQLQGRLLVIGCLWLLLMYQFIIFLYTFHKLPQGTLQEHVAVHYHVIYPKWFMKQENRKEIMSEGNGGRKPKQTDSQTVVLRLPCSLQVEILGQIQMLPSVRSHPVQKVEVILPACHIVIFLCRITIHNTDYGLLRSQPNGKVCGNVIWPLGNKSILARNTTWNVILKLITKVCKILNKYNKLTCYSKCAFYLFLTQVSNANLWLRSVTVHFWTQFQQIQTNYIID